MKEKIIKHRYFLGIMAVALASVLVSYFYIGYKHELVKDAATYYEAAKFLQGGAALGPDTPMNRVLTTPLFLYASNLINFFLKDFILSVAVLNLAFYLLCVYVFYLLVSEIYKENRAVLFASILFASNYYLIDPGNAHLADSGGWFFFILATLLAIRYFKNLSDKRYFYFSVLASAVGMLFKEYGGLGIISLGLLIILSDVPWAQKLKDILLAGVLFLAVVLSWHLFIFFKYHYSYFDWYSQIKSVSGQAGRHATGLVLLIKVAGWVFSLGWLAWAWGAWREWQERNSSRIKILLAALPASLVFVIWPETTQRLAFILVPWLAPTAGFALSRAGKYLPWIFLAAYVLFNYNIRYLLGMINLPF